MALIVFLSPGFKEVMCGILILFKVAKHNILNFVNGAYLLYGSQLHAFDVFSHPLLTLIDGMHFMESMFVPSEDAVATQ